MCIRISKCWMQLAAFLVCICPAYITLGQTPNPEKENVLALVHATIYPSPVDSVITDGAILIQNDKIIAVGKSKKLKIPKGAKIIDCKGLTITAGFWNSHVHFTDPGIANVNEVGDRDLANYLERFLTMYGFSHVFDIGSFLDNTLVIKKRIESGAVPGPFILTTGMPLAPPNGTPFYLKAVNITLPEPNSAAMATEIVDQLLSSGSDGIKIFAASPAELGKEEVLMPGDIAISITGAAHKKMKPVFAHPSVNGGIQLAINSGVDIIAHTTPDGGKPWDSTMIKQMLEETIYVIPTLKLWKWSLQNNKQTPDEIDRFVAIAVGQLNAYHSAGGKVLFGTDGGFMTDYNPTDEYLYMQQAGMSFRQILATLTTIPSEKFNFSRQTGRVLAGMNADLVIFSGNPVSDIKALSNVMYTLRNGEIIYRKQ